MKINEGECTALPLCQAGFYTGANARNLQLAAFATTAAMVAATLF